MARMGNGRRTQPWLFAALAFVAAVAPAVWLWGFTVDDALIAVRYARHLASGAGYRFNLGGPITDGVTPLPWPFLLAPLARAAPLVVLGRAKALGLVAWALTAAAWGAGVGKARAPAWAKLAALGTLALSVPCAAHAVSGMETALATSLCTWAALVASRPRVAAVVAGMAAALRPELAPWAVTVGVGLELSAIRRGSPRERGPSAWGVRPLASGLLALTPFCVCMVVRVVFFGRPLPLAVLAKPSDLAHGLSYAGAASLASLAPIVACAPLALHRSGGRGAVLGVAGAVHLVAVIFAGGDWMPYARLIVPIVPSLLLAFVESAPRAHQVVTGGRLVATGALGVYLLVVAAPAARHVGPDRADLAVRARPSLEAAGRIAALDIGWPSLVTEAPIVDLGGLTDPEVAVLPGGHTSKHVDAAWLLGTHADVVLLNVTEGSLPLASWREAPFKFVVEARLAASDLFAAHFEPAAFLPLGKQGAGYLVMARAREEP